MIVVLLLAAVAALLWGVYFARGASLLLTAVATLMVGYVFGHTFWNHHLGPLPLTLDRLMLVGLVALFAWRWYQGRLLPARVGIVEWVLAGTLVWLTISALLARPDDAVVLPTSPMWRLLFSFWAPALLLMITRTTQQTSREAYLLLGGLTAFGGYLALTAMAETAGAWGVVFPRYIADPTLGLHFGRARGPGLNSVSLGIYLTVCFWAAWLLLPRVGRAWQLVLMGLLPVMLIGILLTFTRSVWIGVITSGAVMLVMQTPRIHRKTVLAAVLGLGVLVGPIAAASLIALKREDSGHASQHSVQQRAAFAYVSWNMFCDNPVTGVGFGRFYDQKLPYLSDRSQTFELESLRGLHHHNTLLSLLTETGLIGLVGYLAVLCGLLQASWRLADSSNASPAARRLGMLSAATLAAYLPSALFHDLSLVHSDQWLVFLIAGSALSFERRVRLKQEAKSNCQNVLPSLSPGAISTEGLPSPSLAGRG